MEAREMLATEWGVSADAWSVTSYQQLRSEALTVERHNRLHPGDAPRAAFVTRALGAGQGPGVPAATVPAAPVEAPVPAAPVIAVTDYLRAVPDQIARFVPRPFTSLGTDGFGRSDTRTALRRFFEVDAAHVAVAVLAALASSGAGSPDEVAKAIARYGLDQDSADPWAI
jgi:pyruvate dehydrogenase E1 component